MILRIPVLYGKTEMNSESAINILIDTILSGNQVNMDHIQPRFPTLVNDVAQAIQNLTCNT